MKKTPATTTKRLSSPRQYRALRELMKGPQTVRQLLDKAGGNGGPQLIDALRTKGLQILTEWHKGQDRDKRAVRFCEYHLLPASRELAEHLITTYQVQGE